MISRRFNAKAKLDSEKYYGLNTYNEGRKNGGAFVSCNEYFGGLWCAETQLKLSYRAGVLAWFREV
ncbi:hypothetical protein [Lentibacter sp.]|uniref:hypothetical protein n=1 Tax=Lentibacter sp. TaxID=2024994 RepID=UPI003F697D24